MPLIGVISDTHGLLRPEALDLLRGVDHIIHAGDIGAPDIIARLEAVAPVSAIRGNVDTQDWALDYPETLQLTLFGRKVQVVHDAGALGLSPSAEGIALVVSGHSHRASIDVRDGVLHLNPGSAGPRRFRLPITLATVTVRGEDLLPEFHAID